jgi:hypothetical protein
MSVSDPEKLRPSEDVRSTALTIQGPLPDELGGAATGVPTVFATFRSETDGFFFERRAPLPEIKFWEATTLKTSVLAFAGWAALEGAAKLTITNAADTAMFVFMTIN